jgi:autotransporter-associated beta strand protein
VALNAGQLDLGGFNATITSLTGSSGTLITDGGGASNLTINAGSDAGVINNGAGVLSLIKGGAGTLALTASNGYTGTTTLGGSGILQVNNAYSLGNGGTLIFNGGTLQLTAGFATSRNYVVNSGQNAIIDTQSFTLTDNGVISTSSGTGGLTKNGSGTLVLNNTETYNGITTINNGTIQLGASGVLPANTLTAATNLILNGTAALDLDGNSIILTGVPTGTGGVITNTGNGTTSTLTINNASGTFVGVLSDTTGAATGTGVLALTKTGSGTLTLKNTRT